MNSSWKTTVFGLMSAIGASVAMLDGLPHWLSLTAKIAAAAGIAGLGLAARDNNVTSEQAGAKSTGVPIRPGVIALFLALALAGVAFNGCTSTPARSAYNVVAAPAVAVDTAMTMWGDYVAQYHPSAIAEMKVKAAFEKYQACELLAIDAAQAYSTLVSGGATNGLGESQLNSLLSSQTAANALADLVNLLRNIGVKI